MRAREAKSETIRRTRRGFTIAEILVAITLIAALAAVTIPTVVAQLNKADAQQVGDGAIAVRAAVNQFIADVRRYPADFADLVAQPADGDLGVIGGKYATTERVRWAGPYLHNNETAARKTGWDLTFDANFEYLLLGTTGLGAGTQAYMTLNLTIDQTKAQTVDNMFDDGDITTGTFRWASGVMKVLLAPIQ